MDERYLREKYLTLQTCFYNESVNPQKGWEYETLTILRQIARDGFIAGAEAQKVAIKLALIDAVETCSIPIKFSEIVAAIKSATVKWEVGK